VMKNKIRKVSNKIRSTVKNTTKINIKKPESFTSTQSNKDITDRNKFNGYFVNTCRGKVIECISCSLRCILFNSKHLIHNISITVSHQVSNALHNTSIT